MVPFSLEHIQWAPVAFPWDCVYFRKKECFECFVHLFRKKECFKCFAHLFRKKECFKCFAHLFQSLHTMYRLKIFWLVLGLYSVYYDREETFSWYCVLNYSVIKNKLGDQTAPVFGCFHSWSTGPLTCMWSFSMCIHADTGNISLSHCLIHRPFLEPAPDWTLQKFLRQAGSRAHNCHPSLWWARSVVPNLGSWEQELSVSVSLSLSLSLSLFIMASLGLLCPQI